MNEVELTNLILLAQLTDDVDDLKLALLKLNKGNILQDILGLFIGLLGI